MDQEKAPSQTGRAALSWRRKCAFTCLLVIALWTCAEVGLRIVGYDFNDPRRALKKVPPFYRLPNRPLGEFAYQRPGPLVWKGRPLQSQLANEGFTDRDYADEREVEVVYDRDGFRNPAELEDWEVVLVGDSFTELGYLPHEQLFSSVLASELNCRVKNLGASHTGPLTHLVYLEHFGIAESTRAAVLVFFEGNDLDDLQMESLRRQRSRLPGHLHQDLLTAGHVAQLSLTRALFQWFQASRPAVHGSAANATYRFADREQRVTVNYAPGELDEGGPAGLLMAEVVQRWSARCREDHVDAWILYMPCKHRVLRPLLQFDQAAHPLLRRWIPNRLPTQLQSLCKLHEVGFLDATPVLVDMANHGRLPFNTVYDTHLNRMGSRAVGLLLAEQLKTSMAR